MSAGLPLVTIPSSHSRIVHSRVLARDFQISVALPIDYETAPARRWPVIVVIDADFHFGLVTDLVRFLNIRVPQCSELPDALVVGIGYPLSGTLRERLHRAMHQRLWDLDATRDEDGEVFMQQFFPVETPGVSGGAHELLAFVDAELLPLIDADYRTVPTDRTLIGHSSGASFVMYALFHRTELFHRYVAASYYPDIAWEEAYAASHDALPVRLHLTMEDITEEHVASHRAWVARLRDRNYAGLRLTESIIPGTHCAMVPRSFQEGLQAVFAP